MRLPSNWIASITPENWEILKRLNVWGLQAMTQRIVVGDRIVFYVTRTQPPAFMGIYEIKGKWRKTTGPVWADEQAVGEVIYTYRTEIKPVKTGTAHVKEIRDKLDFISNKNNYQVFLIGSPANMRRPISDKDFETILSTLSEKKTTIAPKRTLPESPIAPVPVSLKHNDIRGLIQKIGELKSFIAETEHPMDGLRVDVVWKTIPNAAPNWVFEVQIGGDVYEAFTKLKHAYDVWNSHHLYLVTTEDYAEQAEWLLTGAFHQIRHDTKVVHWRKFAELSEVLTRANSLEIEIGLESKT
jgi:predicted RNA-binding protein